MNKVVELALRNRISMLSPNAEVKLLAIIDIDHIVEALSKIPNISSTADKPLTLEDVVSFYNSGILKPPVKPSNVLTHALGSNYISQADLLQFLESNELKASELAGLLNVAQSRVNSWLVKGCVSKSMIKLFHILDRNGLSILDKLPTNLYFSGREIAALRHRLNITQNTLGDALGISSQRISNYETAAVIPSRELYILIHLLMTHGMSILHTSDVVCNNANFNTGSNWDRIHAIAKYANVEVRTVFKLLNIDGQFTNEHFINSMAYKHLPMLLSIVELHGVEILNRHGINMIISYSDIKAMCTDNKVTVSKLSNIVDIDLITVKYGVNDYTINSQLLMILNYTRMYGLDSLP